jgi:UDP-4-amino-4,6-dideoxy-N-acetyl-beta-L-altrosamine N-acetyltransferase
MIIEKYGITLKRVKESDIELIRVKRNSADINSHMHYREIITEEMQKKWFASINNIYNNYFIVYHNNQKIGLVNGKNSDYEKRRSEGGMFIWEKKYWGTVIPAMCSVMMTDFTFLINGFNKNYIKILKENKNAISYNKQLGYVATEDYPSDEETQWYELTRENYLKKIPKLRNGIRSITGDDEPLTLSNLSFKDDSDEDLALLYKPLPDFIKNTVNAILERENHNLL